MRRHSWACWGAALLAWGLLTWGCTPASAPPETAAAPAAPQAASEPALPEGAALIDQLRADLDGDGAEEQVSIYRQGDQPWIRIAPAADPDRGWREALAGEFRHISTRDVDGDRLPEVLIEMSGPGADWYSLAIVRWSGEKGQLLAPKGGPLEGEVVFRSHYYPPLVEDVDGNETGEILIAWDSSNEQFLDTLIYEWTAGAYTQSGGYIVPPRIVPTATPPGAEG